MKISIIIPTNRAADVVTPCLAALARQEFDPRAMEVIVVHNGDGPQPHWPAEAWPFSLATLHVDRASASSARNAGLDRARGALVLFLNDDVVPEPGMVAAHVRAHRGLERPGLVLGRCDWPQYADETVFDRMVHTTSMLFFYDKMEPHRWYGFRHAWTLNLSLRRDQAEAVRFDERFRVYYEDLEWAYRLRERFGLEVWYEPAARALHDHRHTLEDYLAHERHMGRTARLLWEVNPACFREIFASDLDDGYVAYCRRFVEIEGRREEEMLASLRAVVTRRPAELAANAEALAALIAALYVAHLPLKRLAFRRGLVDALAEPDPTPAERAGVVPARTRG